MTLYEEITTGPKAAAIAPFLAIRNDVEIARILSEGRTRKQSRLIGNKDVLRVVGPVVGTQFLDAVYANPNYKYVIVDLEQNNLDITEPLVIAAVEAGIPSLLTREQADALLALGYVSDPVQIDDVSAALNGVI